MMQRERVTEDIFVFSSDAYVQVTAGLILTDEGVVIIDTLLYPDETQQLLDFATQRLHQPVRYVINTHHHADHTMGTCFFEGAQVVAHRRCREILNTHGRESLESTKASSTEMHDVDLVLPQVIFDDEMTLHLGNKTLHFEHMPGHSPDSIVVWVEEDNVLFAADTVMPLPYFVDGSYDDFLASLHKLVERGYETIVQGHGEIILRGEVETRIRDDINYLEKLSIAVNDALASTDDPQALEHALASIKVGACGKSNILLNGVVEELHHLNILALAEQRRAGLELLTRNRS